jgi:hypothetical protein
MQKLHLVTVIALMHTRGSDPIDEPEKQIKKQEPE